MLASAIAQIAGCYAGGNNLKMASNWFQISSIVGSVLIFLALKKKPKTLPSLHFALQSFASVVRFHWVVKIMAKEIIQTQVLVSSWC